AADTSTTYAYVVDDPFLRSENMLDLFFDDPDAMLELSKEATSRTFADPFNPERLRSGLSGNTSEDHWDCILTLPSAELVSWFDGPVEPSGQLEEHSLLSEAFGNERTVTVYTPPGYRCDGFEYPFVVLLDGEMFLQSGAFGTVIDRLIAAGRIPP